MIRNVRSFRKFSPGAVAVAAGASFFFFIVAVVVVVALSAVVDVLLTVLLGSRAQCRVLSVSLRPPVCPSVPPAHPYYILLICVLQFLER